MEYFTVTTGDGNEPGHVRRVECSSVDAAYTVAAQMRKRRRVLVDNGTCTSLPGPGTAVRITHLRGDRGAGRVVALVVWPGAGTVADAVTAAESAVWRWVDPVNPARGACLTAPPAGETGHRSPRFTFTTSTTGAR